MSCSLRMTGLQKERERREVKDGGINRRSEGERDKGFVKQWRSAVAVLLPVSFTNPQSQSQSCADKTPC